MGFQVRKSFTTQLLGEGYFPSHQSIKHYTSALRRRLREVGRELEDASGRGGSKDRNLTASAFRPPPIYLVGQQIP
jgi:hypothetical protein